MTPAARAATMNALAALAAANLLRIAEAAAEPAPVTLAPVPAATEPAPASQSLSGPVLHPPTQAEQDGGTPWEQIHAELGIGRAGLRVGAPQPGAASGPDAHGWDAIVADLNAQAGASQLDTRRSNISGNVAECGFGRVDLRTDAPRAGAPSDDDPHGWGAIVAAVSAELGSRPAAQRLTAAQPSNTGESAEAADWSLIVAEIQVEAGVAPGARQPSSPHAVDTGWAALAAEVAAERQSETKGGRNARS